MNRAHQSHLSSRCQSRSSCSLMTALSALERRQGGKRPAGVRRGGDFGQRAAAPQRQEHGRRRRAILIGGQAPAGRTRKPRRRSTTGSSRPSARSATPGRPAARSAHGGSPRPVRRRPSRRYRGAAGPVRLPPSPCLGEARRPIRAAGQGDQVRERQGRDRMPCCSAHSRARIAAARGFSSAGRNSAKRPDRTPMAFSAARDCGCQGIALIAGDQAQRFGQAMQHAAQSRPGSRRVPPHGEQRRQIVPDPVVERSCCSRTRTRSRSAPSRNSLSSTWTRGRSALVPRGSRATGTLVPGRW